MTKPSKQRKKQIIAPLHIKQKQVRAHLSKELRKKYGKRAMQVRKDDVVRVITGKYKGKEGKVVDVNVKKGYVNIENLKIKRADGKEVYVKFDASNLVIKELNLNDTRRFKEKKKAEKKQKQKLEREVKTPKKASKKEVKKEASKKAHIKIAPKGKK